MINNNDNEYLYEKYKNIIHKLCITEIKKNFSEKYNLEDLKNEAWIGVLNAQKTFDDKIGTKIETHTINYIKYALMSFTRKNIYCVYVAHNELINLKNGFNCTNFKQIEKKYKKQLEKKIITEEKYNEIIEDYKKETIKKPIFELKEYKSENSNEIFGNDKSNYNNELLIENSIFKIKEILIKDKVLTEIEFDFILNVLKEEENYRKNKKKYELILERIRRYIKYKNINYYDFND